MIDKQPTCPDCSGRGYHEDGFCHCPAAQVYIDKMDLHAAAALDALRLAEVDAVNERRTA